MQRALSSLKYARSIVKSNHWSSFHAATRTQANLQKVTCSKISSPVDVFQVPRSFHTTCYKHQEASLQKEEHQFQAETKMLLDIVARSLYSDKEVFVRELISNASDALEKARHLSVTGEVEIPLDDMKICIETDKQNCTLTIRDAGIGMTKEELIKNLGTIARSGSKEFLQQLKQGQGDDQNIIGQFGVGFYSAFMVADKVEVLTKGHQPDSVGYKWISDGSGKYTIEEAADISAGTKITCYLKPESREYSSEDKIKDIVKKYSSFVGYTIDLNGTSVNTLDPLWLKMPKSVSPEEHDEFYKFVSGAYDSPRFTFHFQTDAPISLRALLYFPESKPGMFDLTKESDSGVSLYCRRVLIKSKVSDLVPKWLRFVKGVVDSEDIPLNLSREMLQDSALIRRLRTVLQNKVIRFLSNKATKDPIEYKKFFTDYGIFLKEGILSSQEQVEKEEIARLLMYESSLKPAGEMVSFADYISRMPEDQKNIYYLCAPSRALAEASPYFESLKKKNVEVLFCYENYDEICFLQLRQYNSKQILSVEKEIRESKEKVDFDSGNVQIPQTEANDLMDWLKKTLSGKCHSVKTTPHLASHPCIVTVEEMGAARHFVKTQFSQLPEDSRYSILRPQLEINPSNPIIVKMNSLRESNPRLAELLASQLFHNAMVTAGLIDDPRNVLTSMNELLELVLEKH